MAKKNIKVEVVHSKRVNGEEHLEWSDTVKVNGNIYRLTGSVGNCFSNWNVSAWSRTECKWNPLASAADINGIIAFSYTEVMSFFDHKVNPAAENNFKAMLDYVVAFTASL